MISDLDPNSKVFAKLDFLSIYHWIELSDEASYLTTFLLPSGMYRYMRAPMGLLSSSDEFCRRSDAVIAGIDGVRKLIDDILIEGVDMNDLEKKLTIVLNCCVKHGFTLSEKKFEIGSSIKFAGFIISKDGIAPSRKKLEAISKFPTPTNITALHGFLGLANLLCAFIPNLAALTEKLQGMLKKGIVFQWLPNHQIAFEMIKRDVVKEISLHHFNKCDHFLH